MPLFVAIKVTFVAMNLYPQPQEVVVTFAVQDSSTNLAFCATYW